MLTLPMNDGIVASTSMDRRRPTCWAQLVELPVAIASTPEHQANADLYATKRHPSHRAGRQALQTSGLPPRRLRPGGGARGVCQSHQLTSRAHDCKGQPSNGSRDCGHTRIRVYDYLVLSILVSFGAPYLALPALISAIKARRALKRKADLDVVCHHSRMSLLLNLSGFICIATTMVLVFAVQTYVQHVSVCGPRNQQPPSPAGSVPAPTPESLFPRPPMFRKPPVDGPMEAFNRTRSKKNGILSDVNVRQMHALGTDEDGFMARADPDAPKPRQAAPSQG